MAGDAQADKKVLFDDAGTPWGRGVSLISTCIGDDFSRFVTADVDEMRHDDDIATQPATSTEADVSLIQDHLCLVDAIALNLNPSLANFDDGNQEHSVNEISDKQSAPACVVPFGFIDVACSALNPALTLPEYHHEQSGNRIDEHDQDSLLLSYPKYVDAAAVFINPSLASFPEANVQHASDESLLLGYISGMALAVNPSLVLYDGVSEHHSDDDKSLLQSYLKIVDAAALVINPSLITPLGRGEEQAGKETSPQSYRMSFEKLMAAINPLLDLEEVPLEQWDVVRPVVAPTNPDETVEPDSEYIARVESASPVALCLALMRSTLKFVGGGALFFEPVDQQPLKNVEEESLVCSNLKAVHAMALHIDSALDGFREEETKAACHSRANDVI